MATPSLDFATLVDAIADIHRRLQHQAARAINTSLTVRNWLIGAYIHEFELRGKDRAEYGERLLPHLSERLRASSIPRVDERELRRYRLFYLTYPQIREALPPEWQRVLPAMPEDPEIRETVSPESGPSGAEILRSLSFSHIIELTALDDPIKRRFYELEAIRGQWSVRELRRQIASLAFERTALSTDKAALLEQVRQGTETDTPALVIRDPYVFEFLGIRPQEVMGEGDNPPVGLLLCTRKNHALMEYALAGMDNALFVSRYQLVLPRREELEALLKTELQERGAGKVGE
jgi:hypothetical protein